MYGLGLGYACAPWWLVVCNWTIKPVQHRKHVGENILKMTASSTLHKCCCCCFFTENVHLTTEGKRVGTREVKTQEQIPVNDNFEKQTMLPLRKMYVTVLVLCVPVTIAVMSSSFTSRCQKPQATLVICLRTMQQRSRTCLNHTSELFHMTSVCTARSCLTPTKALCLQITSFFLLSL